MYDEHHALECLYRKLYVWATQNFVWIVTACIFIVFNVVIFR